LMLHSIISSVCDDKNTYSMVGHMMVIFKLGIKSRSEWCIATLFKSFPSTYSNMTLNILPGYLDDSIFHTPIGFDHSIKVWEWQKYKRNILMMP
jgi:hypothetical protein